MALKNQAGLIKIIDAIECMEKSLSCAICLEISSQPVETRCGHLFCRVCIQKVLSNPGESCPVCKFNLTRRGVSSSGHMRLCIQQLAKLIDAVRNDTDIDITSCLKTHYKKWAFLPSASSSSLQSQQEQQNQISPVELDDNTKKNPQNHEDSTDLQKQASKLVSKESFVEYQIQKAGKQTIENLPCKMITKKYQLEANLSQITELNPPQVQNENDSPSENNSDALNKSKSVNQTHEIDPKVNEKTGTSLDENRQCLKDISTLNLNRSLTDQSTKTWSRVAKFGKELRRKSGKNTPRIHKKPKLSVKVRDKSVLLNASHDHSIDREKNGQDRVDHDTDSNNLLDNRHEDDINISVSEIKKKFGENVNSARLNRDNKIISKTKKPETLVTLENEICDENVAFESNVETTERLSNSGSQISEEQIQNDPKKIVQEKQKVSDTFLPSDSTKNIIPLNNTDKYSTEEKEKISKTSLATDSGESLFSASEGSKQSSGERKKISNVALKANSEKRAIAEKKTTNFYKEQRIHADVSSNDFDKSVENACRNSKRLPEEQGKVPKSLNTSSEKEAEIPRVVCEKINHDLDTESRMSQTKQKKYSNEGENVVRFKKLGHLFKAQRKCVTFLYLGSMKPQGSENFNNSETASICKFCSFCQLSNNSTLLQKQSLGSSTKLSRAKSFESANLNIQKLLPLPEMSTSRINEADKRENHFQIPSAPKEQTISPKNHKSTSTITSRKSLVDDSVSSGSSIIGRKRKRSDHEDQCAEEQNGKRVSQKRSEFYDHEAQNTEEPNIQRVSNKQIESPDREDRNIKKRSEELLSKKRFEASDNEDQYSKNESKKQIDKRASQKRSEFSDREAQYTEEQNRKRVSKKQIESPDREDQNAKRQSEELVSKKRSEVSDDEDQYSKNESRKRSCHELSRKENDKSSRIESRLNETQQSRILSKSPQTIGEQLTIQKNRVINSSEYEKVPIEPIENDFRTINTSQEANITFKENSRTLPKPMSVTSSGVPKNVNNTEVRDKIGIEACEPAKSYSDIIAQNSDIPDYEEGGEIDFSKASMMDITGEQLLLKNFEEQLFGPWKPGNVGNDEKRSDNNERCKKKSGDSLAIENEDLMSEPMDQNVSLTKAALVEHNRSLEIENVVELTPTNQNSNRFNNPTDIMQNKKSALIHPNTEFPQNFGEKRTPQTPLRRSGGSEKTEISTISVQSVTKMRPIYQSTPKSSQVSTDRYRSTVYRPINQKENSPKRNLEMKDIATSLKRHPPISRRICILCSGLTSKQCEDVRYLSTLFDMQYTKKFTDDVTHVIVKTNDENNGACKTLKYLQGVAYRKWVLNFKWIVDCLAKKKLLDEESYEVVDSSTLIAGPRKARCGEKGPFDGFVFHCVEPFQNISVPDYEDLLRQMGATVVGSLNELATEESIFKIIALQAECHEKKIIEWHQITKAVPVAQEWIVECISQYRLVSLLPFLQELLPQDILDLGFPEGLVQDDDFMYDVST